MAAAIPGLTSTIPTPTSTATTTTTPQTTTKSLTGGDFLNLMIQQLAQQDPLNPTDSNQLLTQMSQISQLQSNTDMITSLQGLTLQQSIGSAGNLIGKSITGQDDSGNSITGVVTSVKVENKQARLELDSGKDLAMQNVTQIATAGASQLAGLQQLVQNGSSSGLDPSTLLNLSKYLQSVTGVGAS